MKKIILLFCLPLILTACPKEETEPEPDKNPNLLAEAEIGPSGGTLEGEGISITVPEGAFDDFYTLEISEEQTFLPGAEENTLSGTYRIDGIPASYEGAITLRIAAEGVPEEELYMAVGTVETLYETDEETGIFGLFEAEDSSGYIVSAVPSFEPALTGSVMKSAPGSNVSPVGFLILYSLYRLKSQESSYFTYCYPALTDEQQVARLAMYMDQAMLDYFDMGLFLKEGIDAALKLYGKPQVDILSRYTSGPQDWILTLPVLGPVDRESDPMERAGRLTYLKRSRINVSRKAMEAATEADLREVAYVWAYRLLYYIYFGDRMDWYAFASASLMKEKFSGKSFYQADQFAIVGISPFKGMEAGKEQYTGETDRKTWIGGSLSLKAAQHAMGMYPFIRYLDQRYSEEDPQLFGKILAETINGESQKPMEGIINAMPEPEFVWWPEFFKAYLTGQLVDQPADEFLKFFPGVDYQVDFFAEKDTVRFNENAFPDLSAGLYRVSFLFPSFEKEASLNLKVGPSSLNLNYVDALAFDLKNNQLEYIDQGTDFTISGLKSLRENGVENIVIALVNSANEPTTSETLNIELETSLRTAPQDLNTIYVYLMQVRSVYTDNFGDTSEDVVLMLDRPPRKGTMIGNTFTATWSEPYSSGTSSGTITIEFDPDNYPRHIVSYSMTETIQLSDTRTYTFLGDNIDLWGSKSSETMYYFRYLVTGESVCDYLTYANEEYMSYDGSYSYSTDGSVICDTDSEIQFSLYYQEE